MDCLLRPSMDPLIRMLVTKNALRIDANAVKNFPLKDAAAVSFVVKVLEVELHQQLCVRQKSGVILTSAGQTFIGYARRILQLADEGRNALLDSATPTGHLRLGSMETTAAVRLPQLLTKYRQMCPQV